MYDSVNFWISNNEAAGIELPACLNYLDNIIEHNKGGLPFYSGSLKNYKVNVSDSGVSLKGSLAKYYLDDNIQTLSRSDSQMAIEKLSDDLHLPVILAKVTRFDFAQNMLMTYQPEAYFPYLGECQYYQRLLQPQSLYNLNHKRVNHFYNKLAEAKKIYVIIPAAFIGDNLLRFELRYIGRIKEQFGKIVNAGHLSNEQFYIELGKRWLKEYQNIYKNRKPNLNYSEMKSPKDYWKQINLQYINSIGLDEALRQVDEMKAKQVFEKPEYYSRLKKEIKELGCNPNLSETSELIEELDKKINRVKADYR